MAELRFEWDPTKSTANKRKHGVAFEEAESVFADDHAL
ncbi:MAG: BrnT family toxin, partial [Gemmatimonadota bacterium]|nr:BrnT family toxin [Gemmatimonadota bacterium]